MPSGISHMLISRSLPVEDNCPYKYKLSFNTRYFQIGSIAPDLPYASIADKNFLENEDVLANLFHFAEQGQDVVKSPNKLPLLGLERLKHIMQEGGNKRECDALFWFLVGYASHVIADGICHPYVMDKVGRYEGSNKAAHRALEMGIDVLLFKHFTAASGHAIEASYAGTDTFIKGFNEMKYSTFIFKHFADIIQTVYEFRVTPNMIKGWVTGISRLFCMSNGKWPAWFRQLDSTAPFVFRQIADVEGREEDYLVLRKPRFWDQNFLNSPAVHFIDDCLPRFNKLMKLFLDRSYSYVYESGSQIIENYLPAFSLDTGRTVNDPNNIAFTPVLWELA